MEGQNTGQIKAEQEMCFAQSFFFRTSLAQKGEISVISIFFLKTGKFNGNDSVMQNNVSRAPASCNKKTEAHNMTFFHGRCNAG